MPLHETGFLSRSLPHTVDRPGHDLGCGFGPFRSVLGRVHFTLPNGGKQHPSAVGLVTKLVADYAQSTTLTFIAAGNSFPVGYGGRGVGLRTDSGDEGFVEVVGPLIDVPALIGLMNVAPWIRRRCFGTEQPACAVAPGEGAP